MIVSRHSLAIASGLLGGCALLALVAACSSSTGRTSFSDDTTPSPTPSSSVTQAPLPSNTSDPTPVVGDASVPDAPDDCVRTAPSNKCGLVPQCGCLAIETCDVTDDTGNVSCVTAGTAAMGQPCIATAGCQKGLTCFSSTCHAFCNDPGSACTVPNTGACIQVEDQTSTAIPNLDVCLVNCDLRDPNACGGTTSAGVGACVVDDKGNTDCEKGGTVGVGLSCATAACAPGLGCISVTSGSTTTSVCKAWCRVGTADCGAGKTCGGFQTKMMVGAVEYGACP